MGTSGLVGPLATYATMTEAGADPAILVMKIIGLHFVAPALIALTIHMIMCKLSLIKRGDMKL